MKGNAAAELPLSQNGIVQEKRNAAETGSRWRKISKAQPGSRVLPEKQQISALQTLRVQFTIRLAVHSP